jgi:hypothetical protein
MSPEKSDLILFRRCDGETLRGSNKVLSVSPKVGTDAFYFKDATLMGV